MQKCPDCGRILLDTSNDGGFKLRSRLVLFDDEHVQVLCPTCKTKVDMPMKIQVSKETMEKALVPRPKFFVK